MPINFTPLHSMPGPSGPDEPQPSSGAPTSSQNAAGAPGTSPAAGRTHTGPIAQTGTKARQRELLQALRTSGPSSRKALPQASLDDIAATALLAGGLAGKLAGLLVADDTVVGYGGHTAGEEKKLFPEFRSPGFQDERSQDRQARTLLLKAFQVGDESELPATVATAITRADNPLHAVAMEALRSGLVPGSASVGFDTTLAEEHRLFPPFRLGF